MKLLLGITGGIAAYKTPGLVRLLRKAGFSVRIICTKSALKLVSRTVLETVSGEPVHVRMFTPRAHSGVEHIELAQWADAVLVAPATASVLAKMTHGLADDLLSTTLLAAPCPVFVAPGMNTVMWDHPATRGNMDILGARGVHVIGPDAGELACGTSGAGRMSSPERIVETLQDFFAKNQEDSYLGKKVLITAGATREHLDPVRFLSNPSSGRMGMALAREAVRRGALVTLVHGHLEVPVPAGLFQCIHAPDADSMYDAVMRSAPDSDLIIMAAAVGDFAPVRVLTEKLKKDTVGASLTLELKRTQDILGALGAWKRDPGERHPLHAKLVGFAAETAGSDEELLLELARKKRSRKHCDVLFANDVSRPDCGFSVSGNQGVLVFDAQEIHVPHGTKEFCARAILDAVRNLLTRAEGSMPAGNGRET